MTRNNFGFFVLAGFAVLTCRLEAYPVPCNGADPITFVSATVSAETGGSTDTAGNGGLCTATANQMGPSGGDYTTTGSFSNTLLSFNFSEVVAQNGDFDAAGGSGSGSALFLAGSDVTYTITDAQPTAPGGMDTMYTSSTELIDETTGDTIIYNSANGPSNITGQLTPGDEYEFEGGATLSTQGNATLTYNPYITFTSTSPVPEPEDLALVTPLLLAGFAVLRRRRTGAGANGLWPPPSLSGSRPPLPGTTTSIDGLAT